MKESFNLRPIAHIKSDFTTKFGIPRQSGMASSLRCEIIFEPAFRDENALRGLEGYSHIWLIWGFSGFIAEEEKPFSPMVKPPRLGGKKRMGVFATRSPNRPNPIGLSCVKLIGIEKRPNKGCALIVSGADLMDGTPIYDIKPYLPYADSIPDAKGGFAEEQLSYKLEVDFPEEWLVLIPKEKRAALIEALSLDPRPSYLTDPSLPYGFAYAGFDIRFRVSDGKISVFEVVKY